MKFDDHGTAETVERRMGHVRRKMEQLHLYWDEQTQGYRRGPDGQVIAPNGRIITYRPLPKDDLKKPKTSDDLIHETQHMSPSDSLPWKQDASQTDSLPRKHVDILPSPISQTGSLPRGQSDNRLHEASPISKTGSLPRSYTDSLPRRQDFMMGVSGRGSWSGAPDIGQSPQLAPEQLHRQSPQLLPEQFNQLNQSQTIFPSRANETLQSSPATYHGTPSNQSQTRGPDYSDSSLPRSGQYPSQEDQWPSARQKLLAELRADPYLGHRSYNDYTWDEILKEIQQVSGFYVYFSSLLENCGNSSRNIVYLP